MERLGDDELSAIYKKIHKRSDRKSFFQVSKQFMRVALARIHMRALFSPYPALLDDILPTTPNLVTLWYHEPLSNSQMKLLAQSCPKLLVLMLFSLTSKFEFDFDDDGLCAVANSCSDLIRVDISKRIHVGDVGICSLARSCKNLTVLNLGRCVRITNKTLKAIGEITSLEELDLQGCYLITDSGLKYLANGNLKNLTNLALSECYRITDDDIIYLKQMVTLKYLFLSKCGIYVSDTGLVALLSQLPNIQTLDLSWLINVRDISLFVIATKCLKLESIYLRGCKAITSEGLRAFAHNTRVKVFHGKI